MSEQAHPATPRWPFAAMLAALMGAGVGIGLSLSSPGLPGSEALTLEDVVDAFALITFGVLGAVLIYRDRAPGLGRALVLMGVLESLNYLLGGVADAIAARSSGPTAVAQLCSLASQGAFIGAFVLFVLSPLLLFPTGRVPSPRWWWRWPVGTAVVGAATSITCVLLAPGPVDEDVPAWGENPIGLEALGSLVDGVAVAGLLLLAPGLVAGLAAFATRWVRYTGARRRQMAWFSLGAVTMVIGLTSDLGGGSLTAEVARALIIFGTMLVGIGWPLLGPLGRDADPVAPLHQPAGTDPIVPRREPAGQ